MVTGNGTNGASWAERRAGDDCSGVTFGRGSFVAVGGGKIVQSSDGTNWVNRVVAGQPSLRDVAYGNGQFIAVGSTILNSKDGVRWEEIAVPKLVGLNKIAYGSGHFVIIGLDRLIHWSADGINWASNEAPPGHGVNSSAPLQNVAFAGDRFFVVGYGLIARSQSVLPTAYLGSEAAPLQSIRLTIESEAGTVANLQSSTDLMNWFDWRKITNTTGAASVMAPAAGSQTWFRAH
jgi:hypothetical protein